jgi:hypothetical protein
MWGLGSNRHRANQDKNKTVRDHPQYKWEMIELPHGNLYLVEGIENK